MHKLSDDCLHTRQCGVGSLRESLRESFCAREGCSFEERMLHLLLGLGRGVSKDKAWLLPQAEQGCLSRR